MSRHVTAKFDADADADFADEYNLRQDLGVFNIIYMHQHVHHNQND